MSDTVLAQAAYDAYSTARNRRAFNADPLPTWDQVPVGVQAAWLAAVAAVNAPADQAVRGVQGWMAQDLHMALGLPLDESADALHQSHPSWGAWWAHLLDNVRGAPAELNEAYRERANLLAWLAAIHPSVVAPATDVDEPGWHLLYLRTSTGGWQLTWHIHPRDHELCKRVEHVPADDPRAQWDGHTTDQKYRRIRSHVAFINLASTRVGVDTVPVLLAAADNVETNLAMTAASWPAGEWIGAERAIAALRALAEVRRG